MRLTVPGAKRRRAPRAPVAVAAAQPAAAWRRRRSPEWPPSPPARSKPRVWPRPTPTADDAAAESPVKAGRRHRRAADLPLAGARQGDHCYGAKTNGKANDGINLAVPEGTPVKAAEDGVVAYSGNELKGYGNLVLVRHPTVTSPHMPMRVN